MGGLGSRLVRSLLQSAFHDGFQLLHLDKLRGAIVDANVLCKAEGKEFAHQGAGAAAFKGSQHVDDL